KWICPTCPPTGQSVERVRLRTIGGGCVRGGLNSQAAAEDEPGGNSQAYRPQSNVPPSSSHFAPSCRSSPPAEAGAKTPRGADIGAAVMAWRSSAKLQFPSNVNADSFPAGVRAKTRTPGFRNEALGLPATTCPPVWSETTVQCHVSSALDRA